ncbi:shikimate kinase AroK [Candidatus Rariloculus sp.]|uniref:shikimate kinase AroK n=1 Tax=Candidatus Rariloculus sp. TaxID=3101265 RepID=UPI003D115ADF
MADKGNIYLIGPMGVGKTAVGKQLALKLGLEFFDADAEIARRTGVDIAYIFEKEGEAGFREREKNMIAELSALGRSVIATGGGAILDSGTRARLAATGTVIYLRTSIDEQVRRTAQTRKRPLLNTANPRAVLERLRAEREPLYDETADIRFDTTGHRVARVAAAIQKLLEERRALQK